MISIFGLSLLGGVSVAQEPDDGTGLDPTLPIPTLRYDRPPPDFSWEIGLQGSYGDITYWRDEVRPWIGFGVRGGWGKHLTNNPNHRLGVHVLVFMEGPAPIHMTAGVEPTLSWDYVSDKQIWLGAGIGGAGMYHLNSTRGLNQSDGKAGLGATVAGRLGWSQTFSRIGRRLFIGVEPKVRYLRGRVGPSIALMVGSGRGY